MSDKYENEQNDPLKDYYREIARGMNPPAHLVGRVKGGGPVKLLPKSVHVKRFAQAALCYVVGVALLLGAVALLPKLWDRGELQKGMILKIWNLHLQMVQSMYLLR